jgi:hypothetical protein
MILVAEDDASPHDGRMTTLASRLGATNQCSEWFGSPWPAFHTFGGGGRRRFELRFIPHNETDVAVVSHAEEMGVVLIVRTDGGAARFKAESAEIAGLTIDEELPAFDLLLPQDKSEQFGTNSLPLKFRRNGHGTQVQAADAVSVIGVGKDDAGDDPVGVQTDPFVQRPAIFVELLHQGLGAGEGKAEQGIDPGAVLNGQFLYFHGPSLTAGRP